MKRMLLLLSFVLMMGCAGLMDSLNEEGFRHKWMGGNFETFKVGWGNPDYIYTNPLDEYTAPPGESCSPSYNVYFRHRDKRVEVVVVETNDFGRITHLQILYFPDEK